MALKTNFTDDILSESMNGKRQYNVTENSNGTKSLEDVTDYQSVGSTFSAKDMNETNAAVNQAYDDMGDEFNPEVDYAVGDYTIRNNKVWKFTTAHPAGAWDESHVKATKILSEARELTEKLIYSWNGDSPRHLEVYKSGKKITINIFSANVQAVTDMLVWLDNHYPINRNLTIPSFVGHENKYYIGFIVISPNPRKENCKYTVDNIVYQPVDAAEYYGNIEYVI